MNDPATLSDLHGTMDLSVDGGSERSVLERPDLKRTDLERRVGRLEEEVGALKDTRALEERVTQRVTERLQQEKTAEQFTAYAPAPPRAPVSGDATLIPGVRLAQVWLFVAMLADARLLVRM